MRLKTLNGAPLREHLDFSEDGLLEPEKCNDLRVAASQQDDTAAALKWRRLTCKDTRLHTGWSQPYLPGGSVHYDRSFISHSIPDAETSAIWEGESTNLDTTVTLDEKSIAADGFLEHSFIFHDTLLSSQVLPDGETDNTFSSSSFLTTSFGTTGSGLTTPSRSAEPNLILQVPSTMLITPLASVPTARYLHSIYPQTLTPNFLCVLTAAPERREVFVRKGGYKMDLWEIIIADDSRSGFKISFWLRPQQESNSEQTNAQASLLQTLENANVGDIMLLRNIALTSFRDIVYGQSLNSIITRARTSIDVLMKSNGVSLERLGGLPVVAMESFMRVKRWARKHVAVDRTDSRKRKSSSVKRDRHDKRAFPSSNHDDSLPPDTMEAV